MAEHLSLSELRLDAGVKHLTTVHSFAPPPSESINSMTGLSALEQMPTHTEKFDMKGLTHS